MVFDLRGDSGPQVVAASGHITNEHRKALTRTSHRANLITYPVGKLIYRYTYHHFTTLMQLFSRLFSLNWGALYLVAAAAAATGRE